MRKLSLIVLSTALGAASFTAMAQDAAEASPWLEPPADPVTVAPPEEFMLSEEQEVILETWPPEQRAQYDAWPADAQAYFWTLPTPRQEMFWLLSDNDKLALVAMDTDARAEAWEMLEQKIVTEAEPR